MLYGLVTDTSSGSFRVHITISDLESDNSVPQFINRGLMNMPVPKFWRYFEVQLPTDSERNFQEQKLAFEEIPPLLLEKYRGQFVASLNGRIVDSDHDYVTLVHRFFGTFGDVPVYITKIGHRDVVMVDTPFVE